MSEYVEMIKEGALPKDQAQQIMNCKAFAQYGIHDIVTEELKYKKSNVITMPWVNKWIKSHEETNKVAGSMDDHDNLCQTEYHGQRMEIKANHQKCGLYCCDNVH